MITETITKSTSPIAESISKYESLISQLKAQIKEQQEKKRALEKQQRQIEKLIKTAASLEIDWNNETIDYVWQSLTAVLPQQPPQQKRSEWENYIGSPVRNKETLNQGVLKSLHLEESIAIVEIAPNSIAQWPIAELELAPNLEEEVEELIKNPVKKNTSNDFFAWQPTSNSAIATYFNIKTGRTQAVYFGANNKQRLAEIETKLMKWFPGISCSKRMAQRMTDFKYELKVIGWERVPRFDDSDFGWLAGMYDPLQRLGVNVKDYLCYLLEDNPALELEF